MEHVLHFFGGGCGEHMLWPMIVATCSGIGMWVRSIFARKTIEGEAGE